MKACVSRSISYHRLHKSLDWPIDVACKHHNHFPYDACLKSTRERGCFFFLNMSNSILVDALKKWGGGESAMRYNRLVSEVYTIRDVQVGVNAHDARASLSDHMHLILRVYPIMV